jgi:hypothetical protein
MQAVDDKQLFLLCEGDCFLFSCFAGERDGEPLFEVIAAVEYLGEEEVE